MILKSFCEENIDTDIPRKCDTEKELPITPKINAVSGLSP